MPESQTSHACLRRTHAGKKEIESEMESERGVGADEGGVRQAVGGSALGAWSNSDEPITASLAHGERERQQQTATAPA
eukprot:355469-Chlamydomonas_euryale.AAC.3